MMSNATFPAGAGAPPVNPPGHDVPGAPVCSEAERWPEWMLEAWDAGRMLARVYKSAAEADAAEAAAWANHYAKADAAARELYRVTR